MEQVVAHISHLGVATKVALTTLWARIKSHDRKLRSTSFSLKADVSAHSCLLAKEVLQALDLKVEACVYACLPNVVTLFWTILYAERDQPKNRNYWGRPVQKGQQPRFGCSDERAFQKGLLLLSACQASTPPSRSIDALWPQGCVVGTRHSRARVKYGALATSTSYLVGGWACDRLKNSWTNTKSHEGDLWRRVGQERQATQYKWPQTCNLYMKDISALINGKVSSSEFQEQV
jgi:hypothetical protein